MDWDNENLNDIDILKKELLFYKEALDSAPNPIFIKNENAQFIFFNKSYERFFGVNREDLIGTTVEQSTYLDNKDKFRYHIEDLGALEDQRAIRYEDEFKKGNGVKVPALYWSYGFIESESGKRGVIGEIVDIAKVRNLEQRLINSVIGEGISTETIFDVADDVLQFYTTVLNYYDATKILIFEFDYDDQTVKNVANFKRVGNRLSKEALLPTGSLNGMSETMPHLTENIANYVKKEDYIIKDDLAAAFLSDLDCIIYMILIADGYPVGLTVIENPKSNIDKLEILQSTGPFIVDDIEKNKLVDRINHLNFVDKLTDIHNRNRYKETLRELLDEPPESIGILVADVNGLSIINKHYGEQSGDNMLKHSAFILNNIFKDEVYRIGDDEFVVLTPEISCEDFDKLLDELKDNIKNNDFCNISFGYTCASGEYDLIERIEYATELLTVEKQRYYKEFSSDEARISNYARSMSSNLIHEIADGKFTIFLQPQIDLKTGKLTSAEALVRKFDSDNNIMPPSSFLPLLEGEKIIRHLDLFVVEESVKTLARWKEFGLEIAIAINLSRITLMERDIIDEVASICDRYGVSRQQIEIEVTETSNKIDNDQLKDVLEKAIKKGFLVSLDDFGSEYSNLLMITSVEFSQIKFDKSLIDDICVDNRASTIVEYAIKMCAELGISNMLAEGIETEDQAKRLSDINCKYGQGYFFAKPMPVCEFEKKYFSDIV